MHESNIVPSPSTQICTFIWMAPIDQHLLIALTCYWPLCMIQWSLASSDHRDSTMFTFMHCLISGGHLQMNFEMSTAQWRHHCVEAATLKFSNACLVKILLTIEFPPLMVLDWKSVWRFIASANSPPPPPPPPHHHTHHPPPTQPLNLSTHPPDFFKLRSGSDRITHLKVR